MLILIVHPLVEFRETLRESLEDEEEAVVVHSASTQKQAFKYIREQSRAKKPYDMLVTSFDLAQDKNATTSRGGGERLIRFLPDHRHSRTKCVVIWTGGMPENITVPNLQKPVTFLDSNANELLKSVLTEVRRVLNHVAQQRPLSVVFVEDPRSDLWQVWINNQQRGHFPISRIGMLELGSRSELLKKKKLWLKELAEIGRTLQKMFFAEKQFRIGFTSALEDAGGIEKARFSFNVAQGTYRVALEALYGPEPELPEGYELPEPEPESVPFWMLKAPVCRTFSSTFVRTLTGQARRPLFEDSRGLINCLIIEADVSGDIDIPRVGHFTLKKLTNVPDECNWLEENLNANRDTWGIGRVARVCVSRLETGQSLIQQVEQLVRHDEWHLVHFAGHSLYERPKRSKRPLSAGKGYFFLPEAGAGIQFVSADTFSEWLPNAQFLFLSSCHSSEENFVLEMVRRGIPSVLGFRWDIDDDLAAGYAKLLYANLFKTQSIESAFVIARNEARNKYGANQKIWAAPMLMFFEPNVQAEAA